MVGQGDIICWHDMWTNNIHEGSVVGSIIVSTIVVMKLGQIYFGPMVLLLNMELVESRWTRGELTVFVSLCWITLIAHCKSIAKFGNGCRDATVRLTYRTSFEELDGRIEYTKYRLICNKS